MAIRILGPYSPESWGCGLKERTKRPGLNMLGEMRRPRQGVLKPPNRTWLKKRCMRQMRVYEDCLKSPPVRRIIADCNCMSRYTPKIYRFIKDNSNVITTQFYYEIQLKEI